MAKYETSLDTVIEAYHEIRPLLTEARDNTEQALAIYKRKKIPQEVSRLNDKLNALLRFLDAMDSIKDSPRGIPRGDALHGATYRIKPPGIDESVYITVNTMRIGQQSRPVEVFVNSKNMESFQWISALFRLLSAILRQPGPFPAYVIEELKDTHDPQGGYFVPGTGYRASARRGLSGFAAHSRNSDPATSNSARSCRPART